MSQIRVLSHRHKQAYCFVIGVSVVWYIICNFERNLFIMKPILIKLSLLFLVISIISCERDIHNNNDSEDPTIDQIEELEISDGFNYNTTSEVQFTIYALNNQGNPIEGATIQVLNAPALDGGEILLKGTTNSNGVFQSVYPIPTYYEEITIATDYIGLTSEVTTELDGSGNVEVTLGGTPQKSSGFFAPRKSVQAFDYDINYLGNFNSIGVPEYLLENDEISQDFLDDINATLPEGDELFNTHPEYLDPSNKLNIELNEKADVWVTFVHEGAGFKNVLGFYTYDLDNPPTSPSEIEEVTVIFPNISYAGSGGGLYAGNKVKLGIFEANTGIGFTIFSNGWNQSSSQVTEGESIFYSNPSFNKEADPDIRQHTVLIQDVYRERFILAFEDLARDNTGSFHCDQDFNDAVFYVTSSPYEAVIADDIPPIDTDDEDVDDDGIPDTRDDYPNDPDKAFDNFYVGSLAYEDLWPGKGDYDFNDIVINYDINQITDASNKVSEINATYTLRAYGATYNNGFGFEMNVDPSKIESVSGLHITDSYINFNGNSTEAGQDYATIIVFDDAYTVLPHPGSGIGVNTDPDYEYVDPVDVDITISFADPVAISSMTTPPFNPFIIADKRRGYEIHLSDFAPTSLAETELFGQYDDDSDLAEERYYKTDKNLPWGIHIAEPFDYPIEKVEIIDAHLKFAEWAQSNGVEYPDWYLDESGYRNDDNIYTIPASE